MAEGASSLPDMIPSPLDRIRDVLRDTHAEPPRPVTRLGLPLGFDRLLGPHWQRTLRPAAVLVPILDREDGPRVLLTQRSDKLRDHAGQISFPGGRIEPTDASTAAAALREADEEISLDPAASEILGYLHDYPTISRFCVTPVVARVRDGVSFEPDGVEVAAVFEVPLHHVLDLGAYERKTLGKMGMDIPFMELMWEDWRIWGATAGMLHDLASLVAEHA
ncbi:CoA pyrophosphatase [uncultured Abyssibacter sp.]|uniref:CoA pyrophosphatase n=1 Tax=uncultured Abyssibacter sp. TaxID=2320202 RepID=UPI0032B183FC